MVSIFNKAAQHLFGLYQKAEDLIEEEMEFPLSTATLNNAIARFVTKKVDAIDDLHVILYDGWLRLFATVHYKGIKTTLSTDLLLIQFQLDKDVQRMVFEQTSETRVINATFEKPLHQLGFKLALWIFRNILHLDPLGKLLEKLGIITIEHGLFYLDLNRWLKDQYRIMGALKKVQVSHAIIREDTFVLKANLNLRGIFGFITTDDKSVVEIDVAPANDSVMADVSLNAMPP